MNAQAFEDVKSDETATRQAAAVVVMAALSIGFGVGPGFGIPVGFVIYWVSWWAVWVFLMYLAAPSLFTISEAENSWSLHARPTGFAQSPLIFLVLMNFIPNSQPDLRLIVFIAVTVWWFAAMTVAVRPSLRLSSRLTAVGVAGTFLIPSVLIEVIA